MARHGAQPRQYGHVRLAADAGIDLLYNKFDVKSPNAHFGNVRSVKEVNSAANQMGRVRKLSESYGGGGWDMTLRDFKRQGDWEYALGRELHEPAYRTAEHRRCAQVRLSARLHAPFAVVGVLPRAEPPLRPSVSWALSVGGSTIDVLVLEPTTSIWMYYTYNAPRPNRWRTMARSSRPSSPHWNGSGGVRSGVGEHPAQSRFVKGDRFVVGKRAYGTVVLPAQMENVDAATFDPARTVRPRRAAGSSPTVRRSMWTVRGAPRRRPSSPIRRR